jgi:hypothetical protein
MNGKTFAFFTCLGSITNGWQKLFKSHLCSLISASSPRIDPRHTGSWSQNPVVFLSHLRSILLNLRLSIRTSDWGSIWWRGLGDQLWRRVAACEGVWEREGGGIGIARVGCDRRSGRVWERFRICNIFCEATTRFGADFFWVKRHGLTVIIM